MAAIISVTPAPVERSFARNSCITDDLNDISLNTFYIRKKPYQVFFNADKVIWERGKRKKGSQNGSRPSFYNNK